MILLNSIEVKPTIFPDGTSQVWKLTEEQLECYLFRVEWRFESESEFLHLAQLKMLLDTYNTSTILTLPYLPYARQDKLVTNTTTFALSTFSKLLNSLNFAEVFIVDAHSKEAKLINNSHILYPIEELKRTLKEIKPHLLCYPDKGAREKYSTIYSTLTYVYADKVRNQLTGEIESTRISGEVNNKRVLIVDDICDGGATFVNLSKTLYEAGAKEVHLFVTHGLFTKGFDLLTKSGILSIHSKEGKIR